MLLNQLNQTEKVSFLSLCVYAAKSNDIFAVEEHGMIDAYCKEMNIASFDITKIQELSEVTEVLKKSSLRNKKIVLIEIMALLYADGMYDSQESVFLQNFVNSIGELSNKDIEYAQELVVRYMDILHEINDSVNE